MSKTNRELKLLPIIGLTIASIAFLLICVFNYFWANEKLKIEYWIFSIVLGTLFSIFIYRLQFFLNKNFSFKLRNRILKIITYLIFIFIIFYLIYESKTGENIWANFPLWRTEEGNSGGGGQTGGASSGGQNEETLDTKQHNILNTIEHKENIDSYKVKENLTTITLQEESNYTPPLRPDHILKGSTKYICIGGVSNSTWYEVYFNIANIDDTLLKRKIPKTITYRKGEYFYLFDKMNTQSQKDYVSYPIQLNVISDEIILEEISFGYRCWLKVKILN